MEVAPPRRVAVIGSGVAGLVAAYVASRTSEVTLYEADDRLGGHADTHRVPDPATGRELAIDTGFIVHNRRTYPVLLRLFAELGVPTQESEMSLSVSDRASGVEWAGALGPRGLFPGGRNLRDPKFLRMLTEIPRFHRRARRLLETADATPSGDLTTLRSFLDEGGFTPYFRRHFMEPLVAAVWSTDPDEALDFPAAYLFAFLSHHGMLGVFGSPTWRTVTGGSHTYVSAVAAALEAAGGKIALGSPVRTVEESAEGVRVSTEDSVEQYDAVVIATHPDAALGMLAAPTATQTEVLSAIPYAANTALLHTDTSLLPDAVGARAAWNFRRPAPSRGPRRGGETGAPVLVTYDLTRLQRLPTPRHYLVTLGGEHLVDPATVIARRDYAHPQYTPASVAAQARLPEIDTDRIVFAGAYHGWGFHEDGARSGLAAAERLGLSWPVGVVVPDIDVVSGTKTPRESQVRRTTYATEVTHTRTAPVRHRFRLRSKMWLVDLDDTEATHPRGGWRRGTFEGRDHFTGTEPTIRAGLDRFLAEAGLDLSGGRALMAAQPRAFGACFNPISVHWVWAGPDGAGAQDRGQARGAPDATVVEVHNTYGDRHAYLFRPEDLDAAGRGEIDKAMYVSPFHGTDGRYRVAVPAPSTERLRISVGLAPGPQTPTAGGFNAALVGTATTEPALALSGLRGVLSIHLHGVWLWLRRLPVQPRPTDHPAPHGGR